MRDRTLAMKWVISIAEKHKGNHELILKDIQASGVSQKTINDQMRRLSKQGLLIKQINGTDNTKLCTPVSVEHSENKPFKPVPKSNIVKKKH